MNAFTDVIAAVSTPPGKGGVAIIRISGNGAFDIAESVFVAKSGKKIAEVPPRVQIYGDIVEDGEVIDDVLLTRFPAPGSYTGEDTAEIACHGGMLVTRTVLEAVLRHGARPAEAGEFTRRAFLNGRMSLTEAEAVGGLLDATSREQIRLTASPSRARLAARIDRIRKMITEMLSSVYARIDYPDEDLGDFTDAQLLERINEAKCEVGELLATYRTGRAISEGIDTVLCGKPNVGKSSVYNLLVGDDAAIVPDIPGTTPDLLKQQIPLGRVMLKLCDTAGVRADSSDAVEAIGIEKSRKMIEKCELLFTIFDLSRPFDNEDAELVELIKSTKSAKIAILNKSDLSEEFDESRIDGIFDATVRISAKDDDGEAIRALTAIVDHLFTDERIRVGEDAVISSARQHAALTRGLDFLNVAVESLALGYAQDAVSSDLEHALGAISEIDGRAVSEDVVADIFSKFCVGK